nr:RNA-directed DNA polymerase, eukaryota [Tanacetum cinerariifolium]
MVFKKEIERLRGLSGILFTHLRNPEAWGWVSDLNGDGVFRVKDVRNLLDEFFLPRADVPTSRVPYVMRFLKTLLTYSSIVLWLEISISNLRTLIMEEGFSVVNLVYLGGIPLNVWSRETFTRIGKKWGEALDIEDNVDSSFGRKRLCIKTKLPLSILESFKVIFKGKVYMVRAKEMEYTSDEDSDVGPQKVPDCYGIRLVSNSYQIDGIDFFRA